jgi:hypothetical protein
MAAHNFGVSVASLRPHALQGSSHHSHRVFVDG